MIAEENKLEKKTKQKKRAPTEKEEQSDEIQSPRWRPRGRKRSVGGDQPQRVEGFLKKKKKTRRNERRWSELICMEDGARGRGFSFFFLWILWGSCASHAANCPRTQGPAPCQMQSKRSEKNNNTREVQDPEEER